MRRPAHRRELAETAVKGREVSVAAACRAFRVSEACYRYDPKLDEENERIADLLVELTETHKAWGFGSCFRHIRNVLGHPWNHKRVYRIYRALGLNLRMGPGRRPTRGKPGASAVPAVANKTRWMDFLSDPG